MTDEPDLFGFKPPVIYPDAPGHRGVETSIAAADDIAPKLGRLQRLAEETIRAAGCAGLTADELAERLELDRWSIQPRTTELKRKGLVLDSGHRRRNSTGKAAIVWIVPEYRRSEGSMNPDPKIIVAPHGEGWSAAIVPVFPLRDTPVTVDSLEAAMARARLLRLQYGHAIEQRSASMRLAR